MSSKPSRPRPGQFRNIRYYDINHLNNNKLLVCSFADPCAYLNVLLYKGPYLK